MTAALAQARQYLARVIPWPQDGDPPAFCNIHWTFRPKDGKNIKKDKSGKELLPWTGRACRTLNDAVNAVEWALKNDSSRDLYACLSTQRTAIEQTSGKGFKWHKPIREQANVVSLRTIFLDIDFKGGDHGYDTSGEAITALGKFIANTGLPKPSIAVGSGGGLHVYWVLDRALTPDEWTPLAYAMAEATKRLGLRCDQQCTIDSARVLRIPDTFNHKTTPPRPVRIAGHPTDYDLSVEKIASVLEPFRVKVPTRTIAPILDPNIFPPRTPLPDDELGAGIDLSRSLPLNPKEAVAGCGFLREALTTGGKDYTNPLWNLTTLIATFCENGRTLAHNMGRKHIGYTKETTDDLFDRKVREKNEKGLGWPACATISASGSSACATCPHFGKHQSPLHLATPAVPKAATSLAGIGPVAAVPAGLVFDSKDLPSGYERRADGVVCKLLEGEDGLTVRHPICDYPMYAPWIQKNPWELHFTTLTDKPTQIAVPTEVINGFEMRKVLQKQFLMLRGGADKIVGEFFVSWLEKLKASKELVVSTSPFGWNIHNGKIEGFVYGGKVWSSGDERDAPVSDPVLANQYTPTGDADTWVEAAKLITSQGRPSLDAIVASAFGAPLVKFTGQSGLLMSVYSQESGIGKTTALKIAQAVWGDPVRAMQGLADTQNSVINKIGEIRSLPLYWDELKTEDDTKRFVNLVFQLSIGKEKSRMTSRVVQRDVGTWQTILISASNESLMDYVASRTKMTTAGLYRVFEYVVDPPAGQGQISPSLAQRILAKLNDNYGSVGTSYAKFLGANWAAIDKELGEFIKKLEVELTATADERFWSALVACVCMGAKYSNQLGYTQIDETALRAFMITSMGNMRGERAILPADMKDKMNISNILAGFLNEKRARHTLLTNIIHRTQGKPPNGSIKVIGDASRLDTILIHVGYNDKMMRMSSTGLSEWLTQKSYSRHQFIKSLESEFGVKQVRGRIGSGTQYAGATEYLLELDLTGSPLANFLDES